MLVADRISDAGREVLASAGWSWLDRRGHLRLWVPGVRVETPFPTTEDHRGDGSENLWTGVGLEVALYALMHPNEEIRARRVASVIGRSAGATHDLIGRFTRVGLIGPSTHRPLLPDLFWETSARWPDDGWLPLAVSIHEAAERVGPDALVRVDERAATLGGAKIAAAADLPPRCYVSSAGSLRRLRGGSERSGPARCYVRSSPVHWLPELEGFSPTPEHPWRVAAPLVCALRLAADPARGREIVDAWGIVPTGAGREVDR